jgi:hypothetical protein
MSFSETEILFVEKVEDSLISIDRKSYHFKLMRYENSNSIQEASISVDLTSLLDAPGLKLDYIQNQNVKLRLGGKKLTNKNQSH